MSSNWCVFTQLEKCIPCGMLVISILVVMKIVLHMTCMHAPCVSNFLCLKSYSSRAVNGLWFSMNLLCSRSSLKLHVSFLTRGVSYQNMRPFNWNNIELVKQEIKVSTNLNWVVLAHLTILFNHWLKVSESILKILSE